MNAMPAVGGQTLRERVLRALEHFWCPLRVDEELRPYVEGVWGQPVTVDALAELLAAERDAFDQAMARPVWICCGIWPDGHGDQGWWVRSDWPLWVRVTDPDGEQADHARLLGTSDVAVTRTGAQANASAVLSLVKTPWVVMDLPGAGYMQSELSSAAVESAISVVMPAPWCRSFRALATAH